MSSYTSPFQTPPLAAGGVGGGPPRRFFSPTPTIASDSASSIGGASSQDGLLPHKAGSAEGSDESAASAGHAQRIYHPQSHDMIRRPSLNSSSSFLGGHRGAHSPPASLLTDGVQSRVPPARGVFPPAFTNIRHRTTPSLGAGLTFGGGKGHDGTRAHRAFVIDPDSVVVDREKVEPDDELHDPRLGAASRGKGGAVRDTVDGDFMSGVMSTRGLLNLGTLVFLAAAILALFGAYPLIAYFLRTKDSKLGGFNLGGTNASGQIFAQQGLRMDLVDPDTPQAARTRKSFNGEDMVLVFSDEFNTDGRSFYPGDDPVWEATDLHYWGTNNLEWYDPAAITTSEGKLKITLSETPEHNLNFRSGMLQTWNKFCFTGGYLSAMVQLPGEADVAGLWPAFWAMGNLGRAGFGASLEGTWPYSYDACDAGTLQNQTTVDGEPIAAQTGGDVPFNRKHGTNALSFLGGQRLSACTCPQDDHPGPKMADGSLKGRSAPEIDVFEAQVNGKGKMTVSQSGQWAPFNDHYKVSNKSGPAYDFFQGGQYNSYTGEVTQQSTSGVTVVPQGAVQRGGDDTFAEYGFEYQAGHGGYIEWVSGGQPSWRLNAAAMEADPIAQIADRPFPQEPMYIILNLGISENFGSINWNRLRFPNVMSVDWVRVYQPRNKINVGCDPPDFPTADYIKRHLPAYTDANLTLWGSTPDKGGYGKPWPRNRLNPGGCDAPMNNGPGSPTKPKPLAPPLKKWQIAQGQN